MNAPLIQRRNIPEQPRRVDIHAPDSLTLRLGGDIRAGLLAGRTFLMQVAHPQVGAGVDQLSNFRQDPWHRLREINKSGERFVMSGRAAGVAEGKRLRDIHRHIKGVDADGNAFHSLHPQVYGWVHTIFLDSHLTQCRLFGPELTPDEQAQLFEEWREMGLLFGLREQDMPESLPAYHEFFADMIKNTLEYNAVTDSILNMTPPRPEELAWMPAPLWRGLAGSMSRLHRILTLYSLPPAYAGKIKHHAALTERERKTARRLVATVRRVAPRLPQRLRYSAAARRAMGANPGA
jgi:uncharacterized protein (DUF2236 family)